MEDRPKHYAWLLQAATYDCRWQGFPDFVIGSDEVGRGALAGPLVVGAVFGPADWWIEGLNDSKKLSEAKRRKLTRAIYACERAGQIRTAICYVQNSEIDTFGVETAQRVAHCRACEVANDPRKGRTLQIVDGSMHMPGDELCIPKADSFVPHVMAASIIAKVERDDYMTDLAGTVSAYGFERNSGYGTAEHLQAIEKFGISDVHRKSYRTGRHDDE